MNLGYKYAAIVVLFLAVFTAVGAAIYTEFCRSGLQQEVNKLNSGLQTAGDFGPLVAIASDLIDPKADTTAIRLAAVRAEYEEAIELAIAIDQKVREKSMELATLLKEQKRANGHLRTLQQAIELLTVEPETVDPQHDEAQDESQTKNGEVLDTTEPIVLAVKKQGASAVTRVIDGDTVCVNVQLLDDLWLHESPMRLVGINCPELNTPEGVAASAFTQQWIVDHSCRVVLTGKRDKYGRPLGDVYSGDMLRLTAELLDHGHAKKVSY